MPAISPARRIAILLALYALALGALLLQIGDHPTFPYNWESYTAWNYWSDWATAPSAAEILAITDGLMTDSGRGPLIGAPAWLGFRLHGSSLSALRWPVAVIAALAVPLTWEVGRRLLAPAAALVGALLMATSAVFVLYGRTATLVGISLVPGLLTILALVGLLESASQSRRSLVWLVGLQVCLILGAYAYAPVRLLWPLAGLALFIAAITWRDRRRRLLAAALVTVSVVPLVLIMIEGLTTGVWSFAVITEYFQVRGEQLLALGDDPDRYLPYLRERPAAATDSGTLAWNLIRQNVLDTLRLAFDWRTEPVSTQYWHPRGRLWPWPLVPFFWLGLAGLTWRAVAGDWRPRLTLLLVVGLTLPLLLTTRVHVGRLVPVLPLLLLIVGFGVCLVADAVARLAHGRRTAPAPSIRLATMTVLGAALFLVSTLVTVTGYQYLPVETEETRITTRLASLLPAAAEHGGAAVVAPAALGREVEGVRGGMLWLALNRDYRLVDLSHSMAAWATNDDRPPLFVVGVLAALEAGHLPNACGNLYLVYPDAVAEFRLAAGSPAIRRQCPAGLQFEMLPE